MKKLLFRTMMVVGMATALVACEKDEETTGGSSSSIVGTWDQRSERQTATLNGQLYQDTTINYPAGSFLITFTAGGKGYSSDGDTVDYTLNNGVLTLIGDIDGQYDTTIFNASVTSTDLILSQSGTDTFGSQVLGYTYSMNFKRK